MNKRAICLDAESVGYRVLPIISNPRNTAVVHSVFDHAFYLKFKNDTLLSVIKNGDYIGPYSILVNDSKDINFNSIGIKQNIRAVFVDKNAVSTKDSIAIKIGRTSIWSPLKNPKNNALLSKALISLNLRVFRDQIYKCPSREGLVPILEKVELAGPVNLFLKPHEDNFSDKARPYIERLMWGLEWNDSNMALSNASSMLGLGPGLTPSCDDFLAGLMISLTLGGKILSKQKKSDYNFFKKLFGGICKSAKRKTTIYSNHLLKQSRAGEGNKAIIDLINSLVTADIKQVVNCTETLVAMGETSGADIAVGIYYGIRFLISRLELSELQAAGDV